MNFNFDPSTMKSIIPNNRLPEFDPRAVRHYRPAVLPDDFMKRSIDNTEFLRKNMGDGNFIIKQGGNDNPFNIKAL